MSRTGVPSTASRSRTLSSRPSTLTSRQRARPRRFGRSLARWASIPTEGHSRLPRGWRAPRSTRPGSTRSRRYTTSMWENSPTPATVPDVRRARAEAAYVDGTVVGMLALESPVARDLRLILAARDVAQLALLCVGLCAQLAVRVDRVVTGLDPARLRLVGEVGA